MIHLSWKKPVKPASSPWHDEFRQGAAGRRFFSDLLWGHTDNKQANEKNP